MKSKVTDEGVLIPKDLLKGVDVVEIHKEDNIIVVVPLSSHDPILDLGKQPVVDDGAPDASEKHDHYLYNN